MKLFIDRKYTLFALPIIAFLILDLTSFVHGASSEEIRIPLLMFSLYYLLKYFKTRYPAPPTMKSIFVIGIIAGFIILIKYSLLGFWFGWVVAIGLSLLLDKKFIVFLKMCLFFLLGMVVASIPWFIYFGENHSIGDWLDVYVFINFNRGR